MVHYTVTFGELLFYTGWNQIWGILVCKLPCDGVFFIPNSNIINMDIKELMARILFLTISLVNRS